MLQQMQVYAISAPQEVDGTDSTGACQCPGDMAASAAALSSSVMPTSAAALCYGDMAASAAALSSGVMPTIAAACFN